MNASLTIRNAGESLRPAPVDSLRDDLKRLVRVPTIPRASRPEVPNVPKTPIYLDNHATTRPDPRVLEAMWPYYTTHYGNAASVSHRFGWEAGEAVDLARERVAKLIGAEAKEIVFTSGATEANNLAIKGALPSLQKRGRHVIISAVEHKAVLEPVKRLEREGWSISIVPCDRFGFVAAEDFAAAIREDTVFASIIAANNEVGTINPFQEIGRLCRERGIVFHTDATQAVGKIPIDVKRDGVDLLSLSAHKMYGPKGIGALYVRRRDPQVRITPLFDGGGHERGVRGGTPAVPSIVGLGKCAELAGLEMESNREAARSLRDRLQASLEERIASLKLNGHPSLRLPGNLNMSFEGVDGEALMMAMRDIAVSSGAACSSANPEPSHVLLAMGIDEDLAKASLRFGIGRFNTEEEIDFAADLVTGTVERLRAFRP